VGVTFFDLRVRDFMPKSEGKHEKTKLKPLQKKEDTKSSCYWLSKLYDNSIVLTAGTPVSLPRVYRRVQPEFHCSCCARNETLAVSGSNISRNDVYISKFEFHHR
jgi:hypothetical protein